MRYLDPWELESEQALEIDVLGTRVAWTENDNVFIYTGEKTQRDDGYEHIGNLEWEDGPSPHDDMEYNLGRLRNFFINWRNNHAKT